MEVHEKMFKCSQETKLSGERALRPERMNGMEQDERGANWCRRGRDRQHATGQASQTEWNGEEDATVLYRRGRNLTPDNGLLGMMLPRD